MIEFRKETMPINLLKVTILIELAYLLTNSFLLVRDYQDSWILSGLEFPYIIYILSLVLLFLFEKNPYILLAYSIIGRISFLLIPNLKYDFFSGRSMDQHLQYILSQDLAIHERLAPIKYYQYYPTGKYYIESPFFHMAINIFSKIVNISVETSMKTFPMAINTVYPLFTFGIIKLFAPKNDDLLKFGLFISLAPLNSSITYIITGSLFVYIFLYAMFFQTIRFFYKPDVVGYILFILFVFGSTLSHPIETLHFLLIFIGVIVIYNLITKMEKEYLIKYYITGLIINLGWIFNKAYQFDYITALFIAKESSGPSLTPSFFTLLQANLINTLKILVLTYGPNFFLSFLALISIYVVTRTNKKISDIDPITKFILLYTMFIWALTFIGLVLGIGFDYFGRVYRLSYFIYPIFTSYYIISIKNINQKRLLITVILLITIGLSTIQFYSPPFMIPPANTVYTDLDDFEPLMYRGQVNSVYQLEMIKYTREYVFGRIASDAITRNQMIGLTDRDYFNAYVTWYYPLSKQINENINEKEYQYLLLHLPGIAGAYEERADIRSTDVIVDQIENQNYMMIYSNSQSFILLNKFP